MPKISIIISTRNRAFCLETAINSALEQTYGDFEIIIADDASTDETQKLSLDFIKQDSRIKYFRQKNRLGISATWKKAFFEYASGEFATILNDDDEWIEPNFLQNAMKLYSRYKKHDVVAVFSDVLYKHYYESLDFYEESASYGNCFPEFIKGTDLFHGDTLIHTDNGAIYKREALKELELFDHDIFTLDVEMMYKLMLVGNFCYLPMATYRHHIHQACESKVSSGQFLNALQSTKWITLVSDFYKKKYGDDDQIRQWQTKHAKMTWNNLLCRIEFDFEKFAMHLIGHLPQKAAIYIYGTGKAARFLFTLFQQKRQDIHIMAFIDDNTDKDTFLGSKVILPSEADPTNDVLIAIHHYKTACKICFRLLEAGYKGHQIHHIMEP